MLHNNNLVQVDLKCREEETAHQHTKTCPVCFEEKSIFDFWYRNGKDLEEAKICRSCFRDLRQLDKYLAKILDGVYIPVYETPVIKYPINSDCCLLY